MKAQEVLNLLQKAPKVKGKAKAKPTLKPVNDDAPIPHVDLPGNLVSPAPSVRSRSPGPVRDKGAPRGYQPPVHPDEKDLDDILRQLSLKQGDSAAIDPQYSSAQAENRWGFQPDPTMILRGPQKSKHLDITDYINIASSYRDSTPHPDASTSDMIDTIVRAKVGPVKPKLRDVSVEEWNFANIRIMDELFECGKPEVRKYWAYSAQVNLLFKSNKHDIVRVLEFDRAYRAKQAEYGFPWGIELSWLAREYKIEDVNAASTSAPVSQPRAESRQTPRPPPGSIQEACGSFNSFKGCRFGTRCKYQHRCQTCGGGHPKHVHGTAPAPDQVFGGEAKQYAPGPRRQANHGPRASQHQQSARPGDYVQQASPWTQPSQSYSAPTWSQPSPAQAGTQ